jgi:hypothetical protein
MTKQTFTVGQRVCQRWAKRNPRTGTVTRVTECVWVKWDGQEHTTGAFLGQELRPA